MKSSGHPCQNPKHTGTFFLSPNPQQGQLGQWLRNRGFKQNESPVMLRGGRQQDFHLPRGGVAGGASLSSTILSGRQSSLMPRVWVTYGLSRISFPDQTPALFLPRRVVAVGTASAPRTSAVISPTPPDGRSFTAGHGVHGRWRVTVHRVAESGMTEATWHAHVGSMVPRHLGLAFSYLAPDSSRPGQAVARGTNIPGKSRP